jgi:hypothetical protein
MESDVKPSEIDWVFCWRTSTGEVRQGARDAAFNGHPVRYRPKAVSPDAGLRTIVLGRMGTCPHRPRGPRLDEQGTISRMAIHVWGHVDRARLVPARTGRELRVLRDAAHAAVQSGEVHEWALAAICARGQVRWAVHVGGAPAFVAALAARVGAPWTVEVREKLVGSRMNGSQVFCLDGEGHVTETLEADSVFDDASPDESPPLPRGPSPTRTKATISRRRSSARR